MVARGNCIATDNCDSCVPSIITDLIKLRSLIINFFWFSLKTTEFFIELIVFLEAENSTIEQEVYEHKAKIHEC